MLPELFESFDSDTDRAPNGVLEFSELACRIAQELDFGGSLARGWCSGQGAGGAWPGPRRQSAARGHHNDCISGYWRPKIRKNDHASSNSDLKSGVIPILLGYFTQFFSARLAPRAGPGPRQSQGSARAEAGQSMGQSHCRAWQQLAAARGHHDGCIPGFWRPKNRRK
eukprot:gene5894-biopygen19300